MSKGQFEYEIVKKEIDILMRPERIEVVKRIIDSERKIRVLEKGEIER